MTDVMSAPLSSAVNAVTNRNCGAGVFCNGFLVLSDQRAGTPAIAIVLRREGLFVEGLRGSKKWAGWTLNGTGDDKLDCTRTLRVKLSNLTVSGAVRRLLQQREARACLNAERRFPSASSVTGLYSIRNGAPFSTSQGRCSSLVSPSAAGRSNFGRLDGWFEVSLPKYYSGLTFGTEMPRWCDVAELMRSPMPSFSSSHVHQCNVDRMVAVLRALPQFLVRQSEGMLMFMFHAVATDPVTVSGSFCTCRAAFQIVIQDSSAPEISYSVAVATRFASNCFLGEYKIICLRQTLILFLYKTVPTAVPWDSIFVGASFQQLHTLALEPPALGLLRPATTREQPNNSVPRNAHAGRAGDTFDINQPNNNFVPLHAPGGNVGDTFDINQLNNSEPTSASHFGYLGDSSGINQAGMQNFNPVNLSEEQNIIPRGTNQASIAPHLSRQQRSLSESHAYAYQQRSYSESYAYQTPEGCPRGILKNGTYWRRTISESSDDSPAALPLDSDDSDLLFPAISLDSIQPKKTVSFNDHINHIIYRPNSSALARRRRNQKKAANKKKAAARRALSQCDSTDTSGVSSGSEASLEDVSQGFQTGEETKEGEVIKA